ncbi:DedA family protein [Cellulomonas sp. PhB143]|uniref:DedA family protein n=1 Tax=Cellulomonas sp. PhB143 TaxID=2485186 RepID=UPI000F49D95F|nr:VTT domain-containing protein [Cellulomonas sp. PhB143]ROS73675.1 membrane protein DedA with SNARE-associated domain [Cellulomonas sp. PhB143]
MPQTLDEPRYWPFFVFFLAFGLVRTLATYWAGRRAATWARDRSAPDGKVIGWVHAWLTSPDGNRGTRTIERWGVLGVLGSFVVPGACTVVNAAAGVARMPLRRYLPTMIVGCVLHALLYATAGWAAWQAALAAAAGAQWGTVVLVLLLLAALTAVAVRLVQRRRAPRRAASGAAPAGRA